MYSRWKDFLYFWLSLASAFCLVSKGIPLWDVYNGNKCVPCCIQYEVFDCSMNFILVHFPCQNSHWTFMEIWSDLNWIYVHDLHCSCIWATAFFWTSMVWIRIHWFSNIVFEVGQKLSELIWDSWNHTRTPGGEQNWCQAELQTVCRWAYRGKTVVTDSGCARSVAASIPNLEA